jgi:hypothetical protein
MLISKGLKNRLCGVRPTKVRTLLRATSLLQVNYTMHEAYGDTWVPRLKSWDKISIDTLASNFFFFLAIEQTKLLGVGTWACLSRLKQSAIQLELVHRIDLIVY